MPTEQTLVRCWLAVSKSIAAKSFISLSGTCRRRKYRHFPRRPHPANAKKSRSLRTGGVKFSGSVNRFAVGGNPESGFLSTPQNYAPPVSPLRRPDDNTKRGTFQICYNAPAASAGNRRHIARLTIRTPATIPSRRAWSGKILAGRISSDYIRL